MRIVFMGTPDFAVATLAALLEAGHTVVAAYAQPPRRAGRGMEERPTPVHAFAKARGIAVRTPDSLKEPEEQHRFASLAADAAVVVAYGLLLPRPVLDAPRLGCFNVHASLLPRWRGAAPVQRAIMAGDPETGVTIMRMEEGLDTGPMCSTARVPITGRSTAGALTEALADLGARLMVEALAQPELRCVPQPGEGATYARKISKAEARIDFTREASDVRAHIHGLSPFPGAWFESGGKRVKVLLCETTGDSGPPGAFLDDRLTVACGTGALRLLRLQREGKAAMDAEDFLRGSPMPAGRVAS